MEIATAIAGGTFDQPATSINDLPITHADDLNRLDHWLTCHGNRSSARELHDVILDLFDRDANKPAGGEEMIAAGGFPPGDPLRESTRQLAELLLLAAFVGASPSMQRSLARAALCLGLLELILTGQGIVRDPEDCLWALRDRLILLPDGLFPLTLRSVLARRPGFADLYVIRQEWNRYEAGEIAHIENVLPHELKERINTRTDETETTLVSEQEQIDIDEHDTQTTSRFELNEQVSTDTSLGLHLEGQVDTSGQYGPTKLETHLGGSVDFSRAESDQHATDDAKEIVGRAVKRVEKRVHEMRTTRTLVRIEEQNTHRIDNTSDEQVVGLYRWVDKVMRLRAYRYPHRFLLEFEVPEPAAYLRWLEKQRADDGFRTVPPEPFTKDGRSGGPTLVATDISDQAGDANYYLRLAARWHARGIAPPPPSERVVSGYLHIPSSDPAADKTSHDVWITPSADSRGAAGAAGGVDGHPIDVPDGYLADPIWAGWLTTWDQDDSIAPGWNAAGKSYQHVPPIAFVTVGDSQNDPADANPSQRNAVTVARSAVSIPIGGQVSGRRSGSLPITVLAANYSMISIQVRVTCVREEQGALLTWQLATYNELRAAYFELLQAHEEERAARNVQAGVEIEGRSPVENARIVREELKRALVELLLDQPFGGFDDLQLDADGRPHVNIKAPASHTALIQFLEQSLEWEKLVYVLYPYFWASSTRWDDLEGLESPDPEYAAFLRAGSARVVISARPGFSGAVLYFMATGKPWNGGSAPIPDHPEYVSVADEIQAQTGAPDDGTPVGASWETRLPTTLIWLDPDAALPKVNTGAVLPNPPVA